MSRKLNNSEKKVLSFWAILALIIIVGLLIFRIVAPEKFDRFFGASNTDKKYSLVEDRTRYYTVSNSIIKYYSYINSKDSEGIFNMLNENYKQKNKVESKDNIKFEDSTKKKTYNSRLMCQRKLDKGIYSFYVSGFESYLNEDKRLDNKYYEVILDDNNMTFSIQPIDEKTFGGQCHE